MDTDLKRDSVAIVVIGPPRHDLEELQHCPLSDIGIFAVCVVALRLAAISAVVRVKLDAKPDVLGPLFRTWLESSQLLEISLGYGQFAKQPRLKKGTPARTNNGIAGQASLCAAAVDVLAPAIDGILGDVTKDVVLQLNRQVCLKCLSRF